LLREAIVGHKSQRTKRSQFEADSLLSSALTAHNTKRAQAAHTPPHTACDQTALTSKGGSTIWEVGRGKNRGGSSIIDWADRDNEVATQL